MLCSGTAAAAEHSTAQLDENSSMAHHSSHKFVDNSSVVRRLILRIRQSFVERFVGDSSIGDNSSIEVDFSDKNAH